MDKKQIKLKIDDFEQRLKSMEQGLKFDIEAITVELEQLRRQLREPTAVEEPIVPKWTFTYDEKVILRNLPSEYNYIAREKDRSLYIFFGKPTKRKSLYHRWCPIDFVTTHLPYEGIFQSVQWSDDEPCPFREFI